MSDTLVLLSEHISVKEFCIWGWWDFPTPPKDIEKVKPSAYLSPVRRGLAYAYPNPL